MSGANHLTASESKMLTLTISTPSGIFTRATKTAYTHAVVWQSPRAERAMKLAQEKPDDYWLRSGVHARWVKDRGHGVTWHKTEAAAKNAAAGSYMWDNEAVLLGVFPVQGA